jgi:aspartyl protease family protein
MADEVARTIWIVLVLLVVLSSLLARRLPLARLIGWSAGWVALFLGVYYLFTLIEPKLSAWQNGHRGGEVQKINTGGTNGISTLGGQGAASGAGVSITMRDDGHYWVDAIVNGQSVRFLVDSGASMTAVSKETADRLGLPPDNMSRTMTIQTANGEVVATRSTIATMQIGAIQASDMPVVVSPSFGEINVLGMNFLNKLKSWRVENGTMLLEPQ